jgi:hypothetical protein
VVIVQRQADLLEVVAALSAAGRLAGLLDGRQQQGDQDRDDRDDHEQFDERKRGPSVHARHWISFEMARYCEDRPTTNHRTRTRLALENAGPREEQERETKSVAVLFALLSRGSPVMSQVCRTDGNRDVPPVSTWSNMVAQV